MLKLRNIELSLEDDVEQLLLNKVSVQYPRGHFGAIVGPSGCGKSTLIKIIAGIHEPTDGEVLWNGRNLAEEDLSPGEIGYVPQFSIAHESLTVRENIETALRLRVSGAPISKNVQELLQVVGLHEIPDHLTSVLSGGQKRRLALALELTSNPALLLCDEVTSGLDTKSEDQVVALLRDLSRQNNRIVLSVTHSLRHMELYDSITVLYKSRLAYEGPPEMLLPYFKVKSAEEIYAALAERTPQAWHDRFELARTDKDQEDPPIDPKQPPTEEIEYDLPNPLSQFFVLLARRWKLFFREKGQIILHLALILLFPAVVVIFAYEGLPQIQNLSMETGSNVVDQLKEAVTFTEQTSRVGGLISGLIIFQVVLLTLMGANNSAREIVAERLLLEKEKLAGLSVGSYLASKIAFISTLVLAQSIWMTIFVKFICDFPGDLTSQLILLGMANAAMTFVCLGISAWAKSAEQASLISVYFVGFQLPLSGAVLAMPELLGQVVRPFIVTYWSWSGMLQTIRDTRFYDLVQSITTTPLKGTEICIWVLSIHILFGILFAYFGSWRSKWTDV